MTLRRVIYFVVGVLVLGANFVRSFGKLRRFRDLSTGQRFHAVMDFTIGTLFIGIAMLIVGVLTLT